MTEPDPPPRFPGYDVLDKWQTLSWNEATRRAVGQRLAVPLAPRFFSSAEWDTADALCRRILPQPAGRAPVPLVALLDAKLLADHGDGFREGKMPYMREAWRQGIAATEAESVARYGGRGFAALDTAEQNALLEQMQRGELSDPAWQGLEAGAFFSKRLLPDVAELYYGHPAAWSDMGFGGPASPRGYVRMALDRRDPWEAAEAKPGHEAAARRENERVV